MNVFVARLRRAWAGAPRSGSRSPWRLQVAAASFALLLAACGGADEKAGEANPARSAAATALSEARKASADAEVAGEVARRRPRPYERIGITALAASADDIASASADGRVSTGASGCRKTLNGRTGSGERGVSDKGLRVGIGAPLLSLST